MLAFLGLARASQGESSYHLARLKVRYKEKQVGDEVSVLRSQRENKQWWGGVGVSLETYTDFWPSCHQKVKGMLLKSCAPWQKAIVYLFNDDQHSHLAV